MGVIIRRFRGMWIFAASIAVFPSFIASTANAQWPVEDVRFGAAAEGPVSGAESQNALASPNCWTANPEQFPPLDCFRQGSDPIRNWTPQNVGPQAGLGPAVVGGCSASNSGYGSCANGSFVPMFNAADSCTAGVAIDNACISPGPARRFYGGFEFLWLRPHFDQNVAMIIDPPVGNTLRPFDYTLDLSPRAWLGWQSTCSGAGFKTTYWRFDASAAEERATAVVGATPVYLFVYGAGGNLSRNAYADLGETLVSNHRMKLHTLDFEATQQFSLASLQCLAGVGIRLAEMDQHLRGEVYDATDALWEIVTNDLSFQGAGPTVSLQIQRCLANSHFSIFHGLRGALLVCDTHQGIYEMKDGFANELVDIAEQTEILSTGELAIGIQYSQSIGPRAKFFVRGNYECQAWFDVGGPVDSHSTVAFSGIGLASGLSY